MTIEKRLTTVNFTKGGNKKLGVVIHTMGGNLLGTDSWFKNPTSGVSAHYGVDLDGSPVYQWVEEGDQAYAQGTVANPTFKMVLDRPNINPNTYLISIECADALKPNEADRSQQYPALIQLVKEICARNNIPIDSEHIAGHREIRSTKSCPGNIDVQYVINQAKGVPMAETLEQKVVRLEADLAEANKHKNNLQNQVNGFVDDLANGKIVKKEDCDKRANTAYDNGFKAGKDSVVVTPPTPGDGGNTSVDETVWRENGINLTITEGNRIKTINYARK